MDQLYMVAITAAILSFSGCGDANRAETPSNAFTTNLGQPLNSEGYYGDGVYFGGMKIVDSWTFYHPTGSEKTILFQSDGMTQQFNDDGTVRNPLYEYGVSEDGNTLSFYFRYNASDANYKFEYLDRNESYPNCLVTKFTEFSTSYGTSSEYNNTYLCKSSD